MFKTVSRAPPAAFSVLTALAAVPIIPVPDTVCRLILSPVITPVPVIVPAPPVSMLTVFVPLSEAPVSVISDPAVVESVISPTVLVIPPTSRSAVLAN